MEKIIKRILRIVDVLLGLQWGDEGKGKIVDMLTKRKGYKIVIRVQGGPNAGHSIKFGKFSIVLHTIPSGIAHKGIKCVIANGVVVDVAILVFKEMAQLISKGILTFEEIQEKLFISKKAHLILPSHTRLDFISEKRKGKKKIGSTLKGISQTYVDKYGREGLRVGDIMADDFREKYDTLKAEHAHKAASHGFKLEDKTFAEKERKFFEAIETVRKLNLIDSELFLNEAIENGEGILAEGAQGALLDIDFGSWKFVTSSNTTSGGICTGSGIAPNKINDIYGVFKAYCTRVGEGPFPTELFNEIGKKIQKNGNEFGATTGRPRRCGWLDLVALKYAVIINGVTHLAMTKSDILNGFSKVKVCTEYLLEDGNRVDIGCADTMENAKPIYTTFNGWSNCENDDNFQKYVDFIENFLGVPIVMIGTGPERKEIILR